MDLLPPPILNFFMSRPHLRLLSCFFCFFSYTPSTSPFFFAKIHLKDLEDVVSSSTGSEVEIWPQKAHFNYFRVSKSILRQHFTSYMCSANNCVLQICLWVITWQPNLSLLDFSWFVKSKLILSTWTRATGEHWLQIGTDLLFIVTSTADGLSKWTEIDDLKWSWNFKSVFCRPNLFAFIVATPISTAKFT